MRLFGHIPDPVGRHATDKKASALLGASTPPPPSFDGDSSDLEVNDQDKQDCVANTVSETIQLVTRRHLGVTIAKPSRRAIYALARMEAGDPLDQDSGTYIGAAWDAVARVGFASEELWPYDDAPQLTHDGTSKPRWQVRPGARWFAEAVPNLARVGIDYLRCEGSGAALADAFKRAVSSGFGFSYGILVTPAFEEQDGKSPVAAPTPVDEILGGHAIDALSYDPDGVRGRSSWGRGFGDNGRYFISWDYFLTCSDPWVTRAVPGEAQL